MKYLNDLNVNLILWSLFYFTLIVIFNPHTATVLAQEDGGTAEKCKEICPSGYTRCDTCVEGVACYPNVYKCDSTANCADGSDERNCTVNTECMDSEFRCGNGQCIPSSWVCNSEVDCLDASDEAERKCFDHVCGANMYACSATGLCIPIDAVCDDKNDCLQGNDEISCSSDKCEELSCLYSCRPTPEGGQCYCEHGYEVNTTESGLQSCIDYNECHGSWHGSWSPCEQQCTNTEGSFLCTCKLGYLIDADQVSCSPVGDTSFDIPPVVVLGNTIATIANNVFTKITDTLDARAVAVVPENQNVYKVMWTDNTSMLNIMEMNKISSQAGAVTQVQLKQKLENVVSLAVDWPSKNVFLLQYLRNVNYGHGFHFPGKVYGQVMLLNMAKKDRHYQKTIIDRGIGTPQDLALDFQRGLLFVTHFNIFGSNSQKKARITKFDTAGRFVADIVKDKLLRPQGIIADTVNKRLYFVDSLRDVIEMCDYDGRERHVLYEGGHNIPHPYDIAVTGHMLYVTDFTKMAIVTLDILNPRNTVKVIAQKTSEPHLIYQMAIATPMPSILAGNNVCANSGCEQICVAVPSTPSIASSTNAYCMCEDGYVLDKDDATSRSCRKPTSESDSFLLYTYSSIFHARLADQPPDDGTVPLTPIYEANDRLITGMDTDSKNKMIYFSDEIDGEIKAKNIVTDEIKTIATLNGAISSLALDYLHHWLYAADTTYHRIYAVGTEGSHVVLPLIVAPHIVSLAVHPYKGLLFWTADNSYSAIGSLGIKAKSVARSNCDGSEVTKIITQDISKPRGIAVDPANDRIYIADVGVGVVLNCNLDGEECLKIRYITDVQSIAVRLSTGGIYIGGSRNISYLQPVVGGGPAQYTVTTFLLEDNAELGNNMKVLDLGIQLHDEEGWHPCKRLHDCSEFCFTAWDAERNTLARRCACGPGKIISEVTKCVADSSGDLPAKCGDNGYECLNEGKPAGKCISLRNKCDGVPDCPQYDDEFDCPSIQSCASDEFTCASGQCIPSSYECDVRPDCIDLSDEHSSCQALNCSLSQFKCDNGRCIRIDYKCDTDNDCGDGSDESAEICPHVNCDLATEYKCQNHVCLLRDTLCDGSFDCMDGTDEAGCTSVNCKTGRTACSDQSQCYSIYSDRCDGECDCGDCSDEQDCGPTVTPCEGHEFHCASVNLCIPGSWECDGQSDCSDSSDEHEGCDFECSATQFQCANGKCLYFFWMCDGVDDCGDNSDEENCNRPFQCLFGTYKCEGAYKSEHCLNPLLVCDETSDCPNGDDEGSRCTDDTCLFDDGGCSHHCRPSPHGAWCYCDSGYAVSSDNPKICGDIDECADISTCSQSCVNEIGSHRCKCSSEYDLIAETGMCLAKADTLSLLFVAEKDSISYINMTEGPASRGYLSWPSDVSINAVDGNAHTRKLYYTDVAGRKIMSSNFDGSNNTVLFGNGIGTPEDLAVDWISDLIYWTDYLLETVTVGTLDGRYRSVLLSSNITNPRSIVLDNTPTIRLLWWTDWGRYPRVERANLDGTGRSTVISEELYWPNALAIDVYKQRLYVMDAKLDFIDSFDYDGSSRMRLIENHDTVDHPWHIDIFEGFLYWVDTSRVVIERCNKFDCSDVVHYSIGALDGGVLRNMAIVSEAKQHVYPNPCDGASCAHICIPASTEAESYTCRCSTGYSLAADMVNCDKATEDFIIFSRANTILAQPLTTDDDHFDSLVPLLINQSQYTIFDYDSRDGYIYWINENHTRRAHIDGTGKEDFLPHLTSGPEALAIDWLARNMYLADWSTNTISVMKLDGPIYHRRDLLGHNGQPTGVGVVISMCIDPARGKLYWIDAGGQDVPHKISSMNLDGTEPKVLWHQFLQHADELAIDLEGNRLFWTNAGMRSIQMLDLNVNNPTPVNVLSRTSGLSHPVGIAYYKGRVFYTDLDVKKLASAKAEENTTDTAIIRLGVAGLHQIHIYEHSRHTGSGSSCDSNSCEQLCVAGTGNTARCVCGNGYKLQDDKCVEYTSFLLATANNEVHGYSFNPNDTGEAIQYFGSEGDSLSEIHITANVKDRLVYWTDQDSFSPNYGINVLNLQTTENIHLVSTHLGALIVTGICYDWVSGYLYFANHLTDTSYIEVITKEGENRAVLYKTDTERPFQIAVDPISRYLFWTDVGPYPKIVRSFLDGSVDRAIITSGIGTPNAIFAEINTKMIYWSDAQSGTGAIRSADYDGSDQQTIYPSPSPQSIVVFDSQLIWCDSSLRKIQSIPLNTSSTQPTLIRGQLLGLSDIALFDISVQPDSASPCLDSTQECEQLCFPFPNNSSPVCACSSGVLDANGKSCEKPDEYVVIGSAQGLYSLSLSDDLAAPLPPINIGGVNALDLDYKHNMVYYTQDDPPSIVSVAWNEHGHEEKNLTSATDEVYFGLSYDWIHERIYYSLFSPPYGIYSMNIDGSSISKIRSDTAYDIAVHPCERLLFWSYTSISRSNMAGNDYIPLVTDTAFVHGITIDWEESKLYYVDIFQEILARVNFDGTNQETILTNLMFPHRLAVYQDHVYWSDIHYGTVNRVNKYTGSGKKVIYDNRGTDAAVVYDIKIHDSEQQRCNASNQCAFNDGIGCCSRGAICHPQSSGIPACNCEPGYELVNNDHQCVSALTNYTACGSDQFVCGDGSCVSWEFRCDSKSDCTDGSDEDETFCRCNPCQLDEFVCQSGQCIQSLWACDKFKDCVDGSDEHNQCVYPACPLESDFQCDNLLCISNHSVCDGRGDCPDHGDETGCPEATCEVGYVSCQTYPLCIHRFFLCDGDQDCVDNSDESVTHCQSVTCQPGDFQCGNRCLPASFHCDGECDCDDCEDEPEYGTCSHPDRECFGNQFKCAGGKCISSTRKCDGIDDCGDGSDELHTFPECQDISARTCPPDEFSCDTEREAGAFHCLPNYFKCDKNCDCGGCEDEQQDCPPVNCAPDWFECANAPVCFPNFFQCDYEDDCRDGSDEKDCVYDTCPERSHFKCPTSGECIQHSFLCDAILDCNDKSDEEETRCNPPSPHCDNGGFRCTNGECIDWSTVCNDNHDCSDGSDEIKCNINECANQSLSQCQHQCKNTATSYECSCFSGFKLNPADNKTCLDIDECRENPDSCDQFCHNRSPFSGFYSCRCDESGWTLEPDRKTCKPNDPSEPFLVLANNYYIRTLDVDGGDYSLLTQNHLGASYMNLHIPQKKIYYYDFAKRNIDRVDINGSNREVIVNHTLHSVRGLAIDWIGNKLFWSDWSLEEIYTSELNGTSRSTFISKSDNVSRPFALAADSTSRFLYWTDVGLNAYIAKIGFDGTQRKMIISDRIVWPISLAVDVNTKKIWWADGHLNYIGYVNDDGTERHIIEAEATTFVHSLDVFEKWVYWTDADKKTVERANRFTGKNITDLRKTLQFPYDIRVWHPLKQPVPKDVINECADNNGGCSHLCLLSPGGGRKCSCPSSFTLLPDSKTCESQCHSFEFKCGRADEKCIPVIWECDGEYDCKDGSDEHSNCTEPVCPPSQFQCDNTNCTFAWELCDGVDNCGDNSDEGDICDGCTTFQFQCGDGTCIPKGYKCDGEADCSDASDEPPGECTPSCSAEDFTCDNQACVPNTWVCDFDNDCGDGSDEKASLGCESRACQVGWFSCETNYRCIPSYQTCDGTDDCRDNSDEKIENCRKCHPISEFNCTTGNQCVRASYTCDFDEDCLDGSDEDPAHCIGKYRACSESEFRCNSHRCIPSAWKCDYDNDCGDLSDEEGEACRGNTCPEDSFQCASGHCIPGSSKCDGVWNCRDASDESTSAGCAAVTCSSSQFTCKNSLCIPGGAKCDGENNCLDGSDEAIGLCATDSCPSTRFHCMNRRCIALSQMCDGIDNCGDNSDESCNQPVPCTSDQFKCDNLNCIQTSYVCDKNNDCGDDSDEMGCEKGSCEDNNGGCSHTCLTLSDDSIVCTCPDGLQIKKNDRQVCEDIDECSSWSTNECPQTCENVKGSYDCNCLEGFLRVQSADSSSCEIISDAVTRFYVSMGSEIRMFVPHQQKISYRNLQHSGGSIGVMTVDVGTPGYPLLYWADTTAQTISRALITEDLAEQGEPQVVLTNVLRPEGMAYDWMNRVLYYTVSSDSPRIIAATFTPKVYTKTVYQRQPDEPGLIAVNPMLGYLYVVYRKYGGATTIERVSLDGRNSTVLVDQAEVFYPTGLTIDYYKEHRVFWSDRKTNTIWSMDKDGKDVVRIIASRSLGSPVGLQVFAGYMYFLSEANGTLFKMDLFDPKTRNHVLVTGLPRTNDLRLFHPTAFPVHTGAKYCSSISCASTHICLGSFTGPVCKCPDSDRVETAACDPTGKRLNDTSSCRCENGGSCVTNSATAVIECKCSAGFKGTLCQQATVQAATAKVVSEAPPNPSKVVLPVVLVIVVIVILIVAGVLFYLYKKRGKAMFGRSGGAEFRAGDSDDPVVHYAATQGPVGSGSIYIDSHVQSYEEPMSVQTTSFGEPAFDNPIYTTKTRTEDEVMNEISEIRVNDSVLPSAPGSSQPSTLEATPPTGASGVVQPGDVDFSTA